MSWMLFPDNPALSALVLFAIALPFLYAARAPIHGLIQAFIRAIGQPLRLASRWLAGAAVEMKKRNQVVLLAQGREETKQTVEREFERVTAIVRRDLQGYPALQRRLLDELTRIEEDYKKCGEVPPPPPEWTRAVAAIAEIKETGDGLVQKILKDISESIDGIYEKVVAEYRRSYETRHKILEGFQPFWRSLEQTLTRVTRDMTGLEQSAAKIDAQIDKYQQIVKRSENVEHALTASASIQFTIACVVMAIAIGGAFVNFFLIQKPMAAMVGGGEYVFGGLEASHVAALVILLVEAAMGLFLMEALRITSLFPRINNMPDRMRRQLAWISFTILLILAGVEVALAVMRDIIVAADIELKRGLSNSVTAAPVATDWVSKVPVAGQMILGFILPFALTFVAIPLEYLITSGRTVFGILAVAFVRMLSVFLRMVSNILRHVSKALVMLYDAVIFLPLLIERAVRARSQQGDVPVRSSFRKTG
ncbi:MAG TPA: hypothetical protein VJS66_07510 [Burkholderiales bacterium]|nr:hypothetical protein [Burkholderiales bacterium]